MAIMKIIIIYTKFNSRTSNKNIFSVIFWNYKKIINEVNAFLNQNRINFKFYNGRKNEKELQYI